ncbi:hypothetical protein Anas_14065 [Armadillidium nasatum]|uniref:Uncharacterized protein n=1 Tax=Armadillidium nasatum TaxID=96803 RepID=A0A5N5T1Z5_9CRUS|nr:hypothetical protein Anas_14065 [Armadillidium nasatum]
MMERIKDKTCFKKCLSGKFRRRRCCAFVFTTVAAKTKNKFALPLKRTHFGNLTNVICKRLL